jgi:flavin reductase (DIM6/NTAB) family NADH-FMN oxidoreductase RutF
VTVLTAVENGDTHGMTANAFMSVSLDPPLIVVSVAHSAHFYKVIQQAPRFGVSVLAEEQEPLSSHFAGRPDSGLQVRFTSREGMPLIDGAVAYFVAQVVDAHPAGDHTLFVGRVEHYEFREARPLLFHAGKYDQLRG